MNPVEIVVALATGLVAGVYGGLLGLGGGIIMVPAMVLLLGQEQQIAQGTSLLVIIVTALSGTRANLSRSLVDRRLAITLGIGGAAGAGVGAFIALRVLGETSLKRAFAVVLLLAAARLAFTRSAVAEP